MLNSKLSIYLSYYVLTKFKYCKYIVQCHSVLLFHTSMSDFSRMTFLFYIFNGLLYSFAMFSKGVSEASSLFVC